MLTYKTIEVLNHINLRSSFNLWSDPEEEMLCGLRVVEEWTCCLQQTTSRLRLSLFPSPTLSSKLLRISKARRKRTRGSGGKSLESFQNLSSRIQNIEHVSGAPRVGTDCQDILGETRRHFNVEFLYIYIAGYGFE